MAIVKLRELLNRLGNPDWSPEVRQDGERLLTTLEATLAARLGGAPIGPGPERAEHCPVSERGMVVTTWPVYEVTRIDAVDAIVGTDGATAPPPGWALINHRVWRTNIGAVGGFPNPAIYATPEPVGLLGLAGMLGGRLPGLNVDPVGQYVTIGYRPGWGAEEALRGAILEKASAVMINKHDDTIVARGLEGNAPAAVTEEWTADEIAALHAYRVVPGPEWTRI